MSQTNNKQRPGPPRRCKGTQPRARGLTSLGLGSETRGNCTKLDLGKTQNTRVVKAGSPERRPWGQKLRASILGWLNYTFAFLEKEEIKRPEKKSRVGHDRSLAREARDQRGHSGSGASRPGDSRRLPAPRVEPKPWLPRPSAQLHTTAASPAATGAAAAADGSGTGASPAARPPPPSPP